MSYWQSVLCALRVVTRLTPLSSRVPVPLHTHSRCIAKLLQSHWQRRWQPLSTVPLRSRWPTRAYYYYCSSLKTPSRRSDSDPGRRRRSRCMGDGEPERAGTGAATVALRALNGESTRLPLPVPVAVLRVRWPWHCSPSQPSSPHTTHHHSLACVLHSQIFVAILTALAFWVDILPWFGSSDSLQEVTDNYLHR
jgi:hypothetical protein